MIRILSIFIVLGFILTSCSNTSKIISLGKYIGHTYKAYEVFVSDEDIAKSIKSSHGVETAIRHEIIARDIIEEGDFVSVEYKTYINGVLYSEKTDVFKVNSGNYLPDLERQLIGKKSNQLYNIDVIMPDDYPIVELAGVKVRFDIKVLELFYFEVPEMTDDYFKELGYENYDAYFEFRKARKLNEVELHERQLACDGIIEKIAEDSEFYISKQDLEQEYAEVRETQEYIAHVYELPLSDYAVSMLGIDFEDFEAFCWDKAEMAIKKRLVREKLIEMNGFDKLTYEELLDIGVNNFKLYLDMLVEGDTQKIVVTQLLHEFLIKNSIAVD